jgi:hypothetical protein
MFEHQRPAAEGGGKWCYAFSPEDPENAAYEESWVCRLPEKAPW